MDFLTDWTFRLGWILPVWLFAVGSMVGSFLNVVVYRLPAGKSIVHPGSHCPACGHTIRWYHNVPIVSWLVLGGRCYDCRAKISPRYPLVELATGVLFVTLFDVDVWRPMKRVGFELISPEPLHFGIDYYTHYAVDLWLVCSLLAAAFIEFDGRRVPRRVFGLAILVALVAATVVPNARPTIDVRTAAFTIVGAPRLAGLVNAAAGMLAGGVVGLILQFSSSKRLAARGQQEGSGGACQSLALGMAALGACLGWIGGLATGVAAAIALVAVRRLSSRLSGAARLGWSSFALVAAIVWVTIGGEIFR